MAKQKFTFTTADGIVETRSSARAYTHVVVGRRDLVQERARYGKAYLAQQRKTHAWYLACADAEVGTHLAPGFDYTYPVDQSLKNRSREFIAQHGRDADAYAAKRLAEALERIGAGDKGPEVVLQWSMSGANANKAIGTWANRLFTDVKVAAI